ncbi:MAG: type II toxin-antitoxin system RelE/ParE family toxin [Holophagaceae bacterium]
MKPRRIALRPLARRDAEEAAAYYAGEGGLDLELRFITALEAAFRHIAGHPLSGSPRYAGLTRLEGLRFHPLRGFPHLVFYLEAGDTVDIVRILHGERDLPAWLRPPD